VHDRGGGFVFTFCLLAIDIMVDIVQLVGDHNSAHRYILA